MHEPRPSDRRALRRALRATRRALDADVRAANASAVAVRALDLLRRCGLPSGGASLVVGATVADDGELDPGPLLDALLHGGARVAYARVIDGAMGFALVESPAMLVTGPGAVLQPPPEAVAVAPEDLDVVLVPLVAFDERCNRIGRGGGFYDRTFAHRDASSPLLVGLAHDEQLVDDLAPEAHDVPLDHVVTPTAVFARGGR